MLEAVHEHEEEVVEPGAAIDDDLPQEVKEFDINDIPADEAPDEVDPDADADEFPPPPRDALYTCKWDFAETDATKRFVIRKGSKGLFLMTHLTGTIVECDDQTIPQQTWLNRKLRGTITTIVMPGGTSSLTDWLKSVGHKNEVMRIGRLGSKREQFQEYMVLVEQAIMQADQGKVATQWQASYKRVGSDGKDEYIRPKGKTNTGAKIPSSHPINRYSGYRNFPFKLKFDDDLGKEVQVLGGDGQPLRDAVVKFEDPDTLEIVEARANAEIKFYMPQR